MNTKDNALNALKHKPTIWIPNLEEGMVYTYSGEIGTSTGGVDPWGVSWASTEEGLGMAVPDPEKNLLSSDTIVDWRDIITIPDPATYDWETAAATQLEGVDRSVKYVDFAENTGPFERLFALMGMEEALIAMAVEPEAVAELMNAIGDQMIAGLDYAAKYFKPETYTSYDDIASERSTFMSPEAYRKLISPTHKRIVTRVKELGIIPIRHCCGHAEEVVEDFINEGYEGWTSVQPSNDIVGLLKKYGKRFSIIGGYDTNAVPGDTDDFSIIRADVERCYKEYSQYEGYIFWGFSMNAKAWEVAGGVDPVIAEAIKFAHEHPEFQVARDEFSVRNA